MFEFLFKYAPIVFTEGIISTKNLPQYALLFAFFFVICASAILFANWKTVSPITNYLKTAFIVLRYFVLIALFLILIEPVITITQVVPKKSAVLLLVDSSKSMQIKDGARSQTRTELVENYLWGTENDLLARLRENFIVLPFSFSSGITALDSSNNLQNDGEITDLASALSFAVSRSKSQPVSAIILISDGNNIAWETNELQQASDPLKIASSLGQRNIPVFTVGVGSDIPSDLRLVSVDTQPSPDGTGKTNFSAFIQKKGAENDRATVQIWEDDLLIQSENVTLTQDYTQYKSQLEPTEKGFHNYTAKVISTQKEIVTENNNETFWVDNREKSGRILYIEDLHPWEFKFIKRALDREPLVQFTSMVRTGKDYYRQGIRNMHELEQGFPSTRKELFQYEAIIIGSIHSSAFTEKQLNLIRDFVSIRGGGLLMLGGPKAFSQGDWQKTALTDVLPVELYSEQMAVLKNQQAIYKNPFNLQLTPAGFRTPMLQFFPDVKENKQAWNSLPQLLGFHLVGAAKPGATILAKHPAAREKDEHIVMASQNYGRGRTMVMATSSFWRWQMQLPASDNRHEQFWRQIARWLTLSTPPPISVEMDKNSYSPNEKIKMHITVLDSQFQVVPDAQVSVQIKQPVNYLGAGTAQGDPPVGELINLKPVLNLNKPGNYTCEFLPKEEGFYLADVFVHSNNGAYIGHADGAFITKDKNREFLNPALNENYLKHIAQLSKGNFYRIENASELPDKLAVTETVYTKLIEQDLWDAPILFFLILLLLTLEWSIRRARGVS